MSARRLACTSARSAADRRRRPRTLTAKKLISDPSPSDGFRRLWEMGRLDLTVEYIVAFETKYRTLFTGPERLTARKRYEEYQRKPS